MERNRRPVLLLLRPSCMVSTDLQNTHTIL
jgi:hypothetical protein